MENRAAAGIAFITAGIFCISINDMLIKELSGGYPLHQMVFVRSLIGLGFSLIFVQLEGGFSILRTRQPWLHAFRGLLLVAANMTYFAALAALPLADATALFFVAPLFITVLSIPILGEKVGPLRMGAVLVGFAGVVLMQRPWAGREALEVSRIVLLLPVFSALLYATNQLMTRRLGATTKASALSVYIQGTFIIVSTLFWLVAGDGRFAEGVESASVVFLLRAWVWPQGSDWLYFVGLGLNAAVIGYALSAAYRSADAATIAPFEYIGLPLAVFWGFVIFDTLPGWEVWIGMALIMGSGLFVFLRERQLSRRIARGQVKLR
ncbi:DMT family transporter [Marinibacterium profundimaris]|uniref:Membrane protein n=1 Tax=Marinibacterium profundimaris TaxID=1679460 RepID=A0A225NI44_9RHOB|nr:DMT family transporter [Marinibacterium profundimaris]OWU73414.1 membrane protein [Marinibacterium profundimaris]